MYPALIHLRAFLELSPRRVLSHACVVCDSPGPGKELTVLLQHPDDVSNFHRETILITDDTVNPGNSLVHFAAFEKCTIRRTVQIATNPRNAIIAVTKAPLFS